MLLGQLCDLVRIAECLQHAEAAPSCHIRRNRESHSRGIGGRHIEEPATEAQVGRGAECGRGPRLRHPGAIDLIEVDAVRVDRALAKQAVAIVYVEVAAGLRKQALHPGHFIEVLGDMRLDEGIRIIGGEPSGARQLRVGGSRREARGDRVQQSLASMPCREEFACGTLAGLGGIAQILRAVSIHQHLACRHAHAASRGGLEEGLHRGGVHAAEHQRRCRAVAHELVEEELGHLACVRGVGESTLGGKGVVLQPVKQLPAARADDVGLRVVDVGIDESGHQDAVAMLDELSITGQSR